MKPESTLHPYTQHKLLEEKILKRNHIPIVWNKIAVYPNLEDRKRLTLQCFPLYSILKAFGDVRFDFLSLDIEGTEFSVIESILQDMHMFRFNVTTIEKAGMDQLENRGSFLEFDYMMRANGFNKFASLYNDALYARSL